MASSLNSRLVHLDLKGSPPKLSYLYKLLPLFKQLGATGLLIEYEDTFCFQGPLEILAAKHAYNINELKSFLNECYFRELEVIPLIQTFGHMEFVLKHPTFTHLREHEWFPNSICPTTEESFGLLTLMLDQMLDFHTTSTAIHIGCDEVQQLNVCLLCRAQGSCSGRVFCDHVSRLANHCKGRRGQQFRVLIWDDMLRNVEPIDMQMSHLCQLVEPVVWHYGADAIPDVWDRFSCFGTIWAASAFKGASGPTETTPDVALHVCNHKLWLAVIEDKRDKVNWAGIILTGWSRYDHYAILCELLPAALPSLAICLRSINNGGFDSLAHSQASEALGFDGPELMPIIQRPRPQPVVEKWNFIGQQIYVASHRQANLAVHYKELLFDSDCCLCLCSLGHWMALLAADWLLPGVELVCRAWFHSYNVQRKFINTGLVRQLLVRAKELLQEFDRLKHFVAGPLEEIYPSDICEEWTETHLNPYIRKLGKTVDKMEMCLK